MPSNGPPTEARSVESAHRRLSPAAISRLVQAAFPQARVLDCRHLSDGFRNSNFRIELDAPSAVVVLRLYEHDPGLCRKEIQILDLVRGAVPVPEVLFAEPNGLPQEEMPPFLVLRYIEGITFRELRQAGDLDAIGQAARSAGETLAAIGRFAFPKSGWLSAGPDGRPVPADPLLEGPDAGPRFVDQCLASPALAQRVAPALRDQTHALIWSFAPRLAELESETRLVHCDFNKRNVLVCRQNGAWAVAAVLDWEFAICGAPLIDLANFLRYEKASHPLAEPHFSRGFRDGGGTLPKDWRRMARVLDLTALCEMLTRTDLPADVEAELVELVRATVEDRDPQFA